MAILSKDEIIDYFKNGELIRNPFKDSLGQYLVEPSSYDLHAGIIIYKDQDPETQVSKIISITYDPNAPVDTQIVTLQPGQVMFVITHEDVVMPVTMCGTVYAKNKFSRDGILALTTGHVDPGVDCPIVIRLINLRSIPYTFHLGEPIYTVVFYELKPNKWGTLYKHEKRDRKATISQTIESANAALGNALNDLSLTKEFVRKKEFEQLLIKTDNYVSKDECGKEALKYIRNSFWGLLGIAFAILGAIAAIVKIIEAIKKE